MEENDEKIDVYIKLNEFDEIIDIASSEFLIDVTGYIKIDSGIGDRFRHAQSQYLESDLIVNDTYTYKYDKTNNTVIKNMYLD
ncbi:MAG: hypothetical protein IJW28_05925 [Clostridia bacterium]|nr:hypothetical protein [Clostridia bacterium]